MTIFKIFIYEDLYLLILCTSSCLMLISLISESIIRKCPEKECKWNSYKFGQKDNNTVVIIPSMKRNLTASRKRNPTNVYSCINHMLTMGLRHPRTNVNWKINKYSYQNNLTSCYYKVEVLNHSIFYNTYL